MQRTLHQLLVGQHFPHAKIAFLVGPRQVGKTTLARRLLKERGSPDLYCNWDDLEWRREFARAPYGFLDRYRPIKDGVKPLVVLDEIHKFPRWKSYVKGLWDTRKGKMDLLVTGSGRLDVFQRGGDSLLGRYHQYRLHPLSVAEILQPRSEFKNYRVEQTLKNLMGAAGKPAQRVCRVFEDLLRWGGFPEPYLRKDMRQLRLWHRERRQLIIREDLRDMTRIQLLSHIEELVELLIPRVGSLFSYNALREDLQVALESVRLWMGYLRRLYYVYFIRPYAAKMARALKREPKVYLWDWSEVPEEGARFENMVASHLLKWCHFSQDWGFEPLELYFVRDKEKREVDFLITKSGKPWMLIEAKRQSTEPIPALHYFAERMGVKHKFLIVAHLERPGIAGDVRVLDAPTFLSCLP